MNPHEEQHMSEFEDSITYNLIPKDRLVIIKGIDQSYYFDINTLCANYVKSNKLINPFTTDDLSDDIKEMIITYVKSEVVHVTITKITRQDGHTNTIQNNFSKFLSIGEVFVRIIKDTVSIEAIADYTLFIISDNRDDITNNVSSNVIKKSMYEYTFESEISSIGDFKCELIKNDTIKTNATNDLNNDLNNNLSTLYNFISSIDIEGKERMLDIIHDKVNVCTCGLCHLDPITATIERMLRAPGIIIADLDIMTFTLIISHKPLNGVSRVNQLMHIRNIVNNKGVQILASIGFPYTSYEYTDEVADLLIELYLPHVKDEDKLLDHKTMNNIINIIENITNDKIRNLAIHDLLSRSSDFIIDGRIDEIIFPTMVMFKHVNDRSETIRSLIVSRMLQHNSSLIYTISTVDSNSEFDSKSIMESIMDNNEIDDYAKAAILSVC